MKFLIFTCLFIIAHSSFAVGIGEINSVWKNAEVNVCWGERDHLDTEDFKVALPPIHALADKWNVGIFVSQSEGFKNRVRKLIKKHYKKTIAGFEFKGWKNCEDEAENKQQIILIPISGSLAAFLDDNEEMSYEVFKAFSGLSTLGNLSIRERGWFDTGPIFHQTNTKKFILLKKNKIKDLGIIHEFGHAVGLRHEHMHENAAYDEACTYFGLLDFTFEKSDVMTRFFSKYDKYSVMNYCHEHLVHYYNQLSPIVRNDTSGKYSHINDKVFAENRFKGSPYLRKVNGNTEIAEMLSPGDIHAIHCLYKYNSEDYERKCHQDHDLYKDKTLHQIYNQYLNSLK